MMTKSALLIATIFLATQTVRSQEVWLQPKKFRHALNEEMTVSFLTGDNFDGEPWELKITAIDKLELSHMAKSVDFRPQVKPEAKGKLKFKFTEEGTYLLWMQSKESYRELDAEKFNSYLDENGLEEAIAIRIKTNMTNQPAKEFYSNSVKLMAQAGNKTDDTFNRKTNSRIEIIPKLNPYLLKSGDHLQCLVLFDGKPCAHQRIKVWSQIGNTTFQQNNYTENDGTVKFPISNKGPWMVSTVKMIASEKPGAEWETFWCNLIFGIE